MATVVATMCASGRHKAGHDTVVTPARCSTPMGRGPTMTGRADDDYRPKCTPIGMTCRSAEFARARAGGPLRRANAAVPDAIGFTKSHGTFSHNRAGSGRYAGQ